MGARGCARPASAAARASRGRVQPSRLRHVVDASAEQVRRPRRHRHAAPSETAALRGGQGRRPGPSIPCRGRRRDLLAQRRLREPVHTAARAVWSWGADGAIAPVTHSSAAEPPQAGPGSRRGGKWEALPPPVCWKPAGVVSASSSPSSPSPSPSPSSPSSPSASSASASTMPT